MPSAEAPILRFAPDTFVSATFAFQGHGVSNLTSDGTTQGRWELTFLGLVR